MLNKIKELNNMTNEIKYYKAELNGETVDIRATKRDYKIAMVITWSSGISIVDSMNSSPRTRASVLKSYGGVKSNAIVTVVPLTLATKEEHKAIKAAKKAASDARYAERAAQRSA
jgi:hypothetical protein